MSTKLHCNLFVLAQRQLQREKKRYTSVDVINRAIKIRKQLDKIEAERKV